MCRNNHRQQGFDSVRVNFKFMVYPLKNKMDQFCKQEIFEGNISLMDNNSFKDQSLLISHEGLQKLITSPKPSHPCENTLWTTDYKVELPIRTSKQGLASQKPITLNEAFLQTVRKCGKEPALSEKVNGKWQTQSYQEYFENCLTFGSALVEYGIENCAVNIIGFNAPQWVIAYFGSMFARCIPVGIYTTNSKEICSYIAEQSECKVVVAENVELAKKYHDLIKLGVVKYVVIYKGESLPEDTFDGRIMLWKDFMARGKRVQKSAILGRLASVKAGNCCTIVYTSGTTGLPKGVMLSHDNYTFLKKGLAAMLNFIPEEEKRVVSFLPLSHVAAQFADCVVCMMQGMHLHFAEPDALQGSLIKTMIEVRPTFFFSVPRVWEKIHEKLMEIAKSNGSIKTKIATWAKKVGYEQVLNDQTGKPVSFSYKIAKMLVFNKIKEGLGLDAAKHLIFGAAPMHSDVRQYFMSVGMFLMNVYGMSESGGPQTISSANLFNLEDKNFMRQAGTSFVGTELKIVKADPSDKDGEICYRGRNVFMGYYKNREETLKTIDNEGFLHSGDLGYLNENGVLFITGRIKQLIITAAGENIPPLLIEQNIKQAMPWISNIILVGENRRHLTCLITLVADKGKLSDATLYEYQKANIPIKTVQESVNNPLVFKLILGGINKANQKAISRAQTVKTFAILPQDFSTDNGLLTPSLKMKRKQILKRYSDVIEKLYTESKL